MKKIYEFMQNSLPKYLLAAVLIIVPLFPKFPLISVPGTYVAIRFEDLILLLLGIITLIRVIKDRNKFFKDEIVIAFVIFFGINLISLLAGVYLTKTVGLSIGIFNYVRRIEYLVPFFAVITLFTKEQIAKNLSYFVKILIIVIVVAFVYGLGQRYLSFPLITTQNGSYSKGVALRWTVGSNITSTFAGSYDLAGFLVVMLPIFITLLFVIKGNWSKIWVFITICGGLWLLENSLSRISQISYLAAVTLALVLARKFKALVVVLAISLVLIGTSSDLIARFSRVIDVYYQKVVSIKLSDITSSFVVRAETQTLPPLRANLLTTTPTPVPVFEDRSTSIRLNVEWPAAIRAFKINPLLGTGYSSIGLATDNDFLRMLAETGILGLLAFLLIFVRIGKLIARVIPIPGKLSDLELAFVVGVCGAIVGTFISSTFIDLFEASKFATIFWFMVGYAVYLIRNNLNDQNN